jgi:hypothetical protein
MAKRYVYHVTKHGEDWQVKKPGAGRAVGRFETKEQAVDRAVEVAKAKPLGQVVIHKESGAIQSERTYGKDPYPPKG